MPRTYRQKNKKRRVALEKFEQLHTRAILLIIRAEVERRIDITKKIDDVTDGSLQERALPILTGWVQCLEELDRRVKQSFDATLFETAVKILTGLPLDDEAA